MSSSKLARILKHLASASDDELIKFLPENMVDPVPGRNVRADGTTLIYIPNIGYVANPDYYISFRDDCFYELGGIRINGKDVIFSAHTVTISNEMNVLRATFAPLGKYLKLSTITIIPNKPWTGSEQVTLFNVDSITSYDECGRRFKCVMTYGDVVDTILYEESGAIPASSTKVEGNVTIEISGTPKITRRIVQLHPDVQFIDGAVYVLRTEDGPVEFRWKPNGVTRAGQLIDGYLDISANIYQFNYAGRCRTFEFGTKDGRDYLWSYA